MDAIFVRWVVRGSSVIGAPIVPNDDVAFSPLMSILPCLLNHVALELFEDRMALVFWHPLDVQDFSGVKIKRCSFRFWVLTQYWVKRRGLLTVLRV